MTPAKINETIKAREAEIAAIDSAFTKQKAEVQKINDQFREYFGNAQLKVANLNGCIAELRRMLPKPKEKGK
jgi:phage-related protein